MIEALINYGILFIFIILFAGLVVLAKKYPIIATLGKGLRNGFIIAFAFAMLIVFLIVYSFLAYIMKQLLTPRVEDRLAVLRLAEQTLCEEHSLLYLYRLQQSAIYTVIANIRINT